VDEKYGSWQKLAQPGRREKLWAEVRNWTSDSRNIFPKFFFKQRVLEDMIVVAGNVHEKFKSSLRRIEELEHHRKSHDQTGCPCRGAHEDSRPGGSLCVSRAKTSTRPSTN